MRRANRPYLIRRIVQLASLPECKKSKGYFTRDQLVELMIHLEGVKLLRESEMRKTNGTEEIKK